MSDDPTPAPENEADELFGRGTRTPGTRPLDPEVLSESAVGWLGTPGRACLPPAGARAVPRRADTAGRDPFLRHPWVPVGPRNVAGRMRGIACGDPGSPDPQKWFAASAGGGVWRTTDGGRRWEPLPAWHAARCLVVGAIAVATDDPARVYAATGEAAPAGPNTLRGFGVFVSDDGGDTWDNHGGGAANPAHRNGFEALAVDPGNKDHVWAAGVDGAFRSTDGGVTWDTFAAGTYFSDVAFTSSRVLLVRGSSQNGEAAVIRVSNPAAAAASVTSEVASADSASVVIAPRPAQAAWPASGKIAVATSATAFVRFADEDDRHLGIFRTTNLNAALGRTITWTRIADHEDFGDDTQGSYCLCIAVDPRDTAQIVTGMTMLHALTRAAGSGGVPAWVQIMHQNLHGQGLRGHHADQHHLVITGNPSQLWVADDGGIARSLDWLNARKPVGVSRPVPPQAATWQRRDLGIQGAQSYDLAQSPLLPSVQAIGLQDHGTYLRSGGSTWRRVYGADGAFPAFDPDDPYRLDISWYGGLVGLQFPALLDAQFPDGARDLGSLESRALDDGLEDNPPFIPRTARDPQDTGRVLHARIGRLYGLRTATGERFAVEPVGRSFVLHVRLPRAPGGPATKPPRPLRRRRPAWPEPQVTVAVHDTAGARRLGLIPGRGSTIEHVEVTDADRLVVASRLPGPYQLAEGDTLSITVGGVTTSATFRAADGLDLARVTVSDVVRVVSSVATPPLSAAPSFWARPTGVQLVTAGAGPATSIRLGGDALDPLADGLSRLSVNPGTYHGDAGRPASVLFSVTGPANTDFGGGARTLEVSVNGGSTRTVRIEPPLFPDPGTITAGQLASALSAALAGDPVQVHAVPHNAWVSLLAEAGRRVVLTGTAAARLSLRPAGSPEVRLGLPSRTAGHLKTHLRNTGSLDLRPIPPGPALTLVISDGTTATPALVFAAADVADLRAVTVEELHTLLSRHLAAAPAVKVRADLVVSPLEGSVSEIQFGLPAGSGGVATPTPIWAGGQDGGVYLTRDGGARWDDVTSPAMRLGDREVDAIAVHQTDPQTVWAGLSGEATAADDPGFVFRSTDGGQTWQQIGHSVTGGAASGVAVDGRPLGVHALEPDPARPGVLYAATDAGVFLGTGNGDQWAPVNEGLPNVEVVDLATSPEDGTIKAGTWTRGVYQRRIDSGEPDEVRLMIRATELDDGNRPARAAPSLGTAAPAPVLAGSPDIKVVRRRPAGLGNPEDVDGVTFDLDLPGDEVVAGTSSDVMVRVTNAGPVDCPPPPGAAAGRARVVLLWAPAGTGIPPLPPGFWASFAAGPLAAGPQGQWTLGGDTAVPRTIPGGDNGVVSFPVPWPALDDVRSVGLLAVTSSADDLLAGGPLDVPSLLRTERRVAYREVPVRRPEDDRILVIRSTDGSDIIVENPASGEGTSVAASLGFAAVIGSKGRTLAGAPPVPPPDPDHRNLSVPGPAIVVRSDAPLSCDITLDPQPDEADDRAAVFPVEVSRILQRQLRQYGLPVSVTAFPAGFALHGTGGATLVATGTAAANLFGGAGGPGVADLPTKHAYRINAGGRTLTITVKLAGGDVAVPVDLSASRFAGQTTPRSEAIARAVIDDLDAAGVSGLVGVRTLAGLLLYTNGATTITASGAGQAALSLTQSGPTRLSAMTGAVDLRAAPVLHLEVTPRAVVRFDGDPADIPDLALATHPDIRRAISVACELAGVPATADVASVDLRVAASPESGGVRHPVLGGAALAELVASGAAGVAPAGQPGLFEVRTALGNDTLTPGTTSKLYLRVRNTGTVDAANARLRIFRLDLAAAPITATEIASATPAVPAGSVRIAELSWDPGGAAPRQELLLVTADDNPPLTVPATFASLEVLRSFAAGGPYVALRQLSIVPAAP